jgi:hypothetical protein
MAANRLVAIPGKRQSLSSWPAHLTENAHAMRFTKDERWICQNDACGSEILVLQSSRLEGDGPRCSCGSVMKKPYVKPETKTYDSGELLERPSWARQVLRRKP